MPSSSSTFLLYCFSSGQYHARYSAIRLSIQPQCIVHCAVFVFLFQLLFSASFHINLYCKLFLIAQLLNIFAVMNYSSRAFSSAKWSSLRKNLYCKGRSLFILKTLIPPAPTFHFRWKEFVYTYLLAEQQILIRALSTNCHFDYYLRSWCKFLQTLKVSFSKQNCFIFFVMAQFIKFMIHLLCAEGPLLHRIWKAL